MTHRIKTAGLALVVPEVWFQRLRTKHDDDPRSERVHARYQAEKAGVFSLGAKRAVYPTELTFTMAF